jgi:hypothetical protein
MNPRRSSYCGDGVTRRQLLKAGRTEFESSPKQETHLPSATLQRPVRARTHQRQGPPDPH